MIEAWIIVSATFMGKDVEPDFAFDSFDMQQLAVTVRPFLF